MTNQPSLPLDTRTTSIVSRLEAACAAYYGPGANLMTDAAFDALEQELRGLDPNHPFLSRKGDAGTAGSGWPKAKHGQPMASLNKAQTVEAFVAWAASCAHVPGETLVAVDKLDGASLSTRWENGKFVQAITRGDGEIGEDITRNARLVKGIKGLDFPGFTGYLRGEVVVTHTDFKAHFRGQSNPRNTANGTMKRQSDAGDCQHLTVIMFDMVADDATTRPDSKDAMFGVLFNAGFETPEWTTLYGLEQVKSYHDNVTEVRAGQQAGTVGPVGIPLKWADYDIDGLVVQFDSRTRMESLGTQGRGPKGAVAWKFPAEEAKTTLRDIGWQVGKSGRITPVAVFDTVELAGVRVSRASLHNLSNVHRLWGKSNAPCVGATILVSRRNDVIPYVEKVVTMIGGHQVLPTPSICPECSTTLQRDGEYIVCRGDECPAQIAGSMRRWVQKIGVLHVGSALIEALVDAGLVEDIAGLYTVDVAAAEALVVDDRTIGGVATRAFASLHASKTLPLHTILGSLGIPLVGRSTARTILDGTGTETLIDAYGLSRVVISLVDGIGDSRADSFYGGLRKHEDMLERLLQHITVEEPSDGSLKGQTYCMTGGKPKDLIAALEAAGAVQKSSVGASLSFLVAKDVDSTSGKPAKARKHGVEIITHDEARKRAGI